LAALQAAGFALAIVTNQQGVGLGYGTTRQMIAVNQRVFQALAPYGIRIGKVYYCPHTAAEDCGCRKPLGGMVRRALRDFRMEAGRTFVVGDRSTDAEAGRSAGCRTVLVGGAAGECDYRAADFGAAARWITAQPDE
jgi:histidinol-phosphate phosphatase family protein